MLETTNLVIFNFLLTREMVKLIKEHLIRAEVVSGKFRLHDRDPKLNFDSNKGINLFENIQDQ